MPSDTVSERRKRRIHDAPVKSSNPAVREAIKRGLLTKPPATEKILKAKRKFIAKKRRKK